MQNRGGIITSHVSVYMSDVYDYEEISIQLNNLENS